MAAEIERELGLTSELVGGSDGVFDVYLDGTLTYTNGSKGGVPPAEQVIAELQEAIAGETE